MLACGGGGATGSRSRRRLPTRRQPRRSPGPWSGATSSTAPPARPSTRRSGASTSATAARRHLRLGEQREGVLHQRARQRVARRAGTSRHRRAAGRAQRELLLRPLSLHVGQDHDAREVRRGARSRRGAHQAPRRPGTLARVLDARQRLLHRRLAGVAESSTSWRTRERAERVELRDPWAGLLREHPLRPRQLLAARHPHRRLPRLQRAVGRGPAHFYVDSPCTTRSRDRPAAYGASVLDKPYFLILNLAVGGNFDGDPHSDAILPATMLVDYVRVYTASK